MTCDTSNNYGPPFRAIVIDIEGDGSDVCEVCRQPLAIGQRVWIDPDFHPDAQPYCSHACLAVEEAHSVR